MCNTKSGKKDKRKENEEYVIIIGVLRSGFIWLKNSQFIREAEKKKHDNSNPPILFPFHVTIKIGVKVIVAQRSAIIEFGLCLSIRYCGNKAVLTNAIFRNASELEPGGSKWSACIDAISVPLLINAGIQPIRQRKMVCICIAICICRLFCVLIRAVTSALHKQCSTRSLSIAFVLNYFMNLFDACVCLCVFFLSVFNGSTSLRWHLSPWIAIPFNAPVEHIAATEKSSLYKDERNHGV